MLGLCPGGVRCLPYGWNPQLQVGVNNLVCTLDPEQAHSGQSLHLCYHPVFLDRNLALIACYKCVERPTNADEKCYYVSQWNSTSHNQPKQYFCQSINFFYVVFKMFSFTAGLRSDRRWPKTGREKCSFYDIFTAGQNRR